MQACSHQLLPEYHEGNAGQQAADERPVWSERDVVAVLGYPELDQVGRREGHEVRVGGAADARCERAVNRPDEQAVCQR